MFFNNVAHAGSLTVQSTVDAVGKTDFEIFPARLAAKFHADEEKLFETRKAVVNVEERSIGQDGREIWALTTKVPLLNLQGELIGLVGITHDVSDLKAQEQALRRSELQLRESQKMLQLVLDTIPVRVFWKNRESVYLGCNRLFAHDAGLARTADIIGKTDDDMPWGKTEAHAYRADDRHIMENNIAKLDYEEILTTVNGQQMYVQTSKLPLSSADDKVIGILGAYSDITARKQAEAALAQKLEDERQMQEHLKALHEITLHLTRTQSLDEFYRCAVEQGLAHLGFERLGLMLYDHHTESALGTYGTDARGQLYDEHHIRLLPSDLTGVLQRVMDRSERFAFEEKTPLFANFAPIGEGSQAVASLWNGELLGWLSIDNGLHHQPITKNQLDILALYALATGSLLARKLTEIALRESEERYRLIAENVSDVIIKLSPSAEFTFATPSFTNLLGYPLNEVIGTDGFKLVHPDDAPQVLAIMNTSVASAGLHFTLTERLRHKDGHYVWVEVTNTNIYHPDTRTLVEMVGVLRDITERKQAEEALREREERLRVLFETSPDAICLVRLDGSLLDINPAGLVLGGFTREQVIGKHFRELNLYSKPYLQQVEEGLSLTRSGGSRMAEYEVTTARGDLVVIESVTHPITINGELMQLAVIRDITDRRKAEEHLRQSETRYRTTVATMYEGVVVQGIDGAIQLCNAAAERILGLTVDQMMGRTSVDPRWRAVHEDGSPFPGETHPAMVTLHTGQPQSNVLMGIHKPDDTLSWILINSQPLLAAGQSQPYAVVTTFADITERQQAEAALRQALAQEKELGELKSRFVSMASHEFRTPLAAILAAAETLKAYREKMTPTQIESRLEKIRSQVLHMKDIMEDVLQLARIQAGRVEFNPLLADLHLLCQDIVDEFEGQPQHHGRVHYSGSLFPVDLPYDSRLMRQIISNLISNALKYSPAEKPIFITLTQDDTHVTLQVRDEGIGIPTADLKRLFEPFHRATNVGTISGTGLGLSITKQAVEMHHGTITPDTEIGQGTTFTVILPKTSESQPTAQ
ncbi:MAG: PAS domain S-box protein [Anaerolineae bacterium]